MHVELSNILLCIRMYINLYVLLYFNKDEFYVILN